MAASGTGAFKNGEHVAKLVKGSTAFALDFHNEDLHNTFEGFQSTLGGDEEEVNYIPQAAGKRMHDIDILLDLYGTSEGFQSTLGRNEEEANYILQAARKWMHNILLDLHSTFEDGIKENYVLQAMHKRMHNACTILLEYSDVSKKHYGAEAQTCDFANDAAGSPTLINKWVEEQTKEKMKELISHASIHEHTRLYIDEHLSMFVILPKTRTGLAELESKLTPDILTELMTKVGPKRKAMLHLPRFKLEHQFSAKDMLQALGMKDAFSDATDLSGISGNKDLQISEVLHGAVVEVNEEGTEAAAATAVIMKAKMMIQRFIFDHPFLLLLLRIIIIIIIIILIIIKGIIIIIIIIIIGAV